MRELLRLAVILGVVIGALPGAANVFGRCGMPTALGWHVFRTMQDMATSSWPCHPAAVMSLLILRTLLRRGTLLESNIVTNHRLLDRAEEVGGLARHD